LAEWVSNFLRDDQPYYGDADYDDAYLPADDPMPGGDADGLYDDIIDDGILESLIIIMLAGALVVLIYWRQQHQLRHRGEQQAAGVQRQEQNGQQPQQQDRGLFPQPGDPDFNAWVAGGIGH
jgi:SEL1 protein